MCHNDALLAGTCTLIMYSQAVIQTCHVQWSFGATDYTHDSPLHCRITRIGLVALWIPHCDLHSHCSHLHSCPNTGVFPVKWLSFLGSLLVSFFEVFNLMPQSCTKAGGAYRVFNISWKHKILFLYLLLSHRKTRAGCKVQYTPVVPCCPEMNSGNCFQWEWTILNNRDLTGMVLRPCSLDVQSLLLGGSGTKRAWEKQRH